LSADRSPPRETTSHRWRDLAKPVFDRFPWPARVSVLILIGLVTAEQVAEEILFSGNLTLERLFARLLLGALAVYLLLAILFLKRQVVLSLVRLRRAVDLDPASFANLTRRMIRPSRWVEYGLLLASLAVVAGLFLGLKSDFPFGGTVAMTPSPWVAAFFLATYVLIGWLGLSLVSTALQHALGLRRLAQAPLVINVFDPDNLVPFGTLSLLHSLTLVGVMVLLIIPLGMPSGLSGLMVVGLSSLGSLLALILPIWGVYLQTRDAKEKALSRIYDELEILQEDLLGKQTESPTDLNARTNALVNLRKTILEVPNWPFRSTMTIVRATTAATSPLIYFVLIELVRAYFVPVLVR